MPTLLQSVPVNSGGGIAEQDFSYEVKNCECVGVKMRHCKVNPSLFTTASYCVASARVRSQQCYLPCLLTLRHFNAYAYIAQRFPLRPAIIHQVDQPPVLPSLIH